MSILKVGDKAPDFKLFSSDKKEVTLKSLKGQKILLLFFPSAYTGVCTQEMCDVRDSLVIYNTAKAHVLGIYPDSVFVLEKLKEVESINFPLLSDYNREVSEAYGAQYKEFPVFDMKRVPKRAAFIIDKDGKIAYAEVKEDPKELPDFTKIQILLQELS